MEGHGVNAQGFQVGNHHLAFGLDGFIAAMEGVAVIKDQQFIRVLPAVFPDFGLNAGEAAQGFYLKTAGGVAGISMFMKVGVSIVYLHNAEGFRHDHRSFPIRGVYPLGGFRPLG